MRIMVTGGAGFIGGALARHLHDDLGHEVVTVDRMTYAAVAAMPEGPRHAVEVADVADVMRMRALLDRHAPDAIVHLAAETHVDRSIDDQRPFLDANVNGTFGLLEAVRAWLPGEREGRRAAFRLVHVSTDEVFGSLGPSGAFTEDSPYGPRSPYSATKAASDHLARAWRETYGLPTIVTNCSNNYGPRQFPEKLIPLMTLKAAAGEELPVYGDGGHVRDWLHVEDHARALAATLDRGRPGETYCFGGGAERTSLEVARLVCRLVDDAGPPLPAGPRDRLVRLVPDRPGHDRRYAIDGSHARRELGWAPVRTFEEGLRDTVAWYLANRAWVEAARARYRGARLGLGSSGAAAAP